MLGVSRITQTAAHRSFKNTRTKEQLLSELCITLSDEFHTALTIHAQRSTTDKMRVCFTSVGLIDDNVFVIQLYPIRIPHFVSCGFFLLQRSSKDYSCQRTESFTRKPKLLLG
ncbi:hypothetical protein DICVIV_09061 [Dictyocaulus viviparus]|uniref:Uncharacterized protein n=1 Tax=Dictyocaulus viviparus TaxID=29172 RepID=A0A0D8XK02_DICVI|nr:hypothetical protein DICVIV_09061 [Dictyocaulus viviparus]